MAGFASASTLAKVVLILLLLGFILHLIGFATPYWTSGTRRVRFQRYNVVMDFNTGLWKSCTETAGQTTCGQNRGELPGWFEATQAFETLGFIAALAALVLTVLYIFVPATAGKRIVFVLAMLACFVAAGCIILGIIIYGSKVKNDLSWSFALCTIAGIIFGVSGILLVVDMLKR